MTDCNFPSDSVASETVSGKFIQLDGLDIPELAKDVLSVLQLDSFLAEPVFRMEVVGNKDELVDFCKLLNKAGRVRIRLNPAV